MSFRLLMRILLPALFLNTLCAQAQLKEGHYFQAIAGGDEAIRPNTLWYYREGEKQTFSATLMMRSRDYEYDMAESILFYGDRVDADGQPLPEAIATIPEAASRLLLRFTKLATPDDRGLSYDVQVISDDTWTFPFGSFHFVNVGTKDTEINLDGIRFLLEKGASRSIQVRSDDQAVSINIAVQNPEDMQWSPFYSNRWVHREDLRTLVFIVDTPEGEVTALRYRQFKPDN